MRSWYGTRIDIICWSHKSRFLITCFHYASTILNFITCERTEISNQFIKSRYYTFSRSPKWQFCEPFCRYATKPGLSSAGTGIALFRRHKFGPESVDKVLQRYGCCRVIVWYIQIFISKNCNILFESKEIYLIPGLYYRVNNSILSWFTASSATIWKVETDHHGPTGYFLPDKKPLMRMWKRTPFCLISSDSYLEASRRESPLAVYEVSVASESWLAVASLCVEQSWFVQDSAFIPLPSFTTLNIDVV